MPEFYNVNNKSTWQDLIKNSKTKFPEFDNNVDLTKLKDTSTPEDQASELNTKITTIIGNHTQLLNEELKKILNETNITKKITQTASLLRGYQGLAKFTNLLGQNVPNAAVFANLLDCGYYKPEKFNIKNYLVEENGKYTKKSTARFKRLNKQDLQSLKTNAETYVKNLTSLKTKCENELNSMKNEDVFNEKLTAIEQEIEAAERIANIATNWLNS